MDSKANAWAWRSRLSPEEAKAIIDATRSVAGRFYRPDELAVARETAA
jgi:hypothetical protein